MNVTPEMVRAEMDYRLERALAGTELEHVREARRVHRSWWQRTFGHQRDRNPQDRINEARLAA
jgi:hypothetical protein